jgi:hypothetical protein
MEKNEKNITDYSAATIAAIERGLAQAKEGKVSYIGSFAEYADIDLEEDNSLNSGE